MLLITASKAIKNQAITFFYYNISFCIDRLSVQNY